MKLLLIFLFIVQTLCLENLSFEDWIQTYDIDFESNFDKNLREQIFYKKLREIEQHNADPSQTYKMAVNEFSHLRADEFIESRCKTILPENHVRLARGYDGTKKTTEQPSTSTSSTESTSSEETPVNYPFGSYTPENAPSSADFRHLMEAVQSQGNCGSCWAFATMGQLEAMMKIRNASFNALLGPQYLVDCDWRDTGCNGGWPGIALDWLQTSSVAKNAAPLMTTYPYKAKRQTCKRARSKIALSINEVTDDFYGGDEGRLKAQIANYGPTIVAIMATPDFQSYGGGVFYDPTCPSGPSDCDTLNHAVIVTGYGTDPVYGDYWLVKNSWGPNWGEAGYVRMARNRNNNCNIACWAMLGM